MKNCVAYFKVTLSADTCQDIDDVLYNIINASDLSDYDEIYDIELVNIVDDSPERNGDYDRFYNDEDY